MKIELTEDGKDRLKDFVRFGKHLKSSSDIDPLYPILRSIIVQHKMTEEQAYWFTFLYVAWYNVAVGYRAWLECPEPDPDILTLLDPSWPTGVERRASRGGRVREHIDSFLTAADGYRIQTWFNRGLNADAFELEDQHANWRILNERLQTLRMNGRWAAYKHCEVLRRVHYVMVQAPDMGNQFSSGPREGLAFLYGELDGQGPKVISRLDRQGLNLQRRVARLGLEVDIEELETILCNWKSVMKGKYYVGHDIDENQEQIHIAVEKGILTEEQADTLWIARQTTLPHEYLGELNGWNGVQKDRQTAYMKQRKIVRRS